MTVEERIRNVFHSNTSKRALTAAVLGFIVFLLFSYLPPFYTTIFISIIGLYSALVELPRLASHQTFLYWMLLIFYLSPGIICMILMNESYFFRQLLFIFLVLTITHDTAAYLTGKFFGATPIAPTVSPRKTWEGCLGAFALMIVTSFLIFTHLNFLAGRVYAQSGIFTKKMFTSLPWQAVIIAAYVLAFLVSLLSVTGDLFESYLKRRVGLKDSGTILPGHGGVLDRIDSLLFVVPVMYSAIAVIIYFTISEHVTVYQLLFEDFWKIGLLNRLFIS
jgi:phosphatidate cytidylyltransferase